MRGNKGQKAMGKRVKLSLIVLLLGLSGLLSTAVQAQDALENPTAGSFQSGIGVISGWVCNASRVDIEIDGNRTLQAAYGTSRNDTQSVCGDDGNNGFGLLFNWNLLGDGQHTLRALRDGVEFARVSFVVATLGDEFLQGAQGQFPLPEFPEEGQSVTVQWQQSSQNFVLSGASASAGGGSSGGSTARLENPEPGSSQSGIGVISGWICTADRVDIDINGVLFQAAYGTSRADTADDCGDDGNNGFGLLFNWNLVGNGQHTLRVLRNGTEEVARADFTVTTLGLGEFVRDLNGDFSVPNFPTAGTQTRLQWQESLQNFVITADVAPGVGSSLGGSQTSTVADAEGDSARFTTTNPLQRDGHTLILQLQAMILGAQPGGNVRGQTTAGSFFACEDLLEFVQDGQRFTAESFDWLDTLGNRVCRELGPDEILNTTVTVLPGVSLNFNRPFQVRYAGQLVADFSAAALSAVQPVLAVTPTTLNFASVTSGSSAELAFALTNQGVGTLTASVSLSADSASAFSLVSEDTINLGAGQSQTIGVRFSPTDPGSFVGMVNVVSNVGASSIDLHGVSGASGTFPRPFSVSADTLDFGKVAIDASRDMAFTVMNTTGDSLSVSVSTEAPFTVVGGGSFTLGAFQSQLVTVRFSPPAEEAVSGSVSVAANGGVATVNLAGIGVLPPQLTVVPPESFGSVTVGSAADVSFLVTNSGELPLTGSATTAAPFSIVVGETFTLEPGQDQTITVRFSPTGAGVFTGTATVTSDGGTATIDLSGVGVLPPQLEVSPLTLDLGSVTIDSSAEAQFTVSNSGGLPLTGSVTTAAPFSIVAGETFTLGPGESQTVTVRFSPTAAGIVNGTATVSSNVDTQIVSLAGAGVLEPPMVAPTMLDFGSVTVGSFGDAEFTVSNSGGGVLTGRVVTVAPFSIVAGGTFTLGPGESETVIVRFSPTSDGPVTGSVSVTSDGGDADVSLVGVGVPVPASISGRVSNALTGAPIPGASVEAIIDEVGVGIVVTDQNGQYMFSELVPGPYTVAVSISGFLSSERSVEVIAGSDTQINFGLSPPPPRAVRIVLNWGAAPPDLDSHLWLPVDTPYHMFFGRKGSTAMCPFAGLDLDDVDGVGPETTTTSQVFPGTYLYAVHNFSAQFGGTALTSSQANVQVFDSAGLIASVDVPNEGIGDWWNVLTIDGTTGQITVINQIGGDPSPYLDTAAGCDALL